jgi:hypothetical protein
LPIITTISAAVTGRLPAGTKIHGASASANPSRVTMRVILRAHQALSAAGTDGLQRGVKYMPRYSAKCSTTNGSTMGSPSCRYMNPPSTRTKTRRARKVAL